MSIPHPLDPVPPGAAGLSTVVVGEALVDVVTAPNGTATHPGGSPMNVAFGLGRLGVPTRLFTRIGTDAPGAAIAEHLATAGVLLDDAAVVAGPTATATAVLDAAGRADYTFDIVWDVPPLALPADTALLHTGSIAAVLEPGADEVRRLLAEAHGRVLISLDPNVRPSITPDHAAVRTRLDALAALAHIVKLSDEDAAWLYPGDDLEIVVGRLLAGGSTLVVVTLGAAGCLLAMAGVRQTLPAPPVALVDTIGAGDAFMSGLLYGVLSRGLAEGIRAGILSASALDELGRLALDSARITVSRAGATPPMLAELAS